MPFSRLLFLTVLSVAPIFAQIYHLQELIVGGHRTLPYSINNLGAIAGYYALGESVQPDGSQFVVPADRYKIGYRGINNFGDLIGSISYNDRFPVTAGALYRNGQLVRRYDFDFPDTTVDGLNSGDVVVGGNVIDDGTALTWVDYPGAAGTKLYGIGWDRTVVGCFFFLPPGSPSGTPLSKAFLRGPKGKFLELRIPNAVTSCAYAINEAAGEIAGVYQETLGGPVHGFVYDYAADLMTLEGAGGVAPKTIPIKVVDYPGAESTTVRGINGKGVVVGWANTKGGTPFGFIGTPVSTP